MKTNFPFSSANCPLLTDLRLPRLNKVLPRYPKHTKAFAMLFAQMFVVHLMGLSDSSEVNVVSTTENFGALVNEGAARGHRITLHTRTRVSDIVAHEGGVWVTSDAVTQQAALAFDHAILATGHSVPKTHGADPAALGRSVEPNLSADAIRLGILGTSLSGIDVAIDHAMRIGRFKSVDGRLTFAPTDQCDRAQGPLITMMSRGGRATSW